MPFKGSKKNYTNFKKNENGDWVGNFFKSNSIDQISKVLDIINIKKTEIKQIVIDDSNYLMACEVMDRAEEKGFDKHIQIAKHYYQLITKAVSLRDDLKIIFLSHIENVGDSVNPKFKLKTAGRMLDNTVNIDGLFTYVIYTELVENEQGTMDRVFRTNTIDGSDSCKTPRGCFKDLYISNDLQLVVDAIDKYNNDEDEIEDETEEIKINE